ncbi:TonB-dependent receptor plug domain-containing protein [Sphingomicrobium nitratireducens]|uniref:TonB-dependent receptor plug domain-containing protein n=1 Tax=Sphingomicrobium nitratireducens TaxID=2964666 RepID=UPI00223FD7C4|nr:TonB-dependent receptor [Sphingomicrobium nitratireducens]
MELPPPPPAIEQPILVTASRAPVTADETSDAVSLLEADLVEALGEPRIAPLLALLPSVALAEAGPAGSQAQMRIRGAEANHSLLFIDGIKANDPAAGNEARFELLSAALGDTVELVRGPQSALWGSEAIGGVVALRSDPGRTGLSAIAEWGSDDDRRLGARLAVHGLVAEVGVQGSNGIDSFGADGERDGYDLASARLAGRWSLAPGWTLDAAGFAVSGTSEYDGFDPVTFLRADTLDETDNKLAAGRLGVMWKGERVTFSTGAGHLASRNVNRLADAEINRTRASRSFADLQAGIDLGAHSLTLAADYEAETFKARDVAYGGFTDQKQQRDRLGLVAEWRFSAGKLSGDAAIRHDLFEDFADATSLSAGLLWKASERVALFANAGEGIAQPTFYDLHGFFPGSFVGNPDLAPEHARGFDLGVRYAGTIRMEATVFAQWLEDEIVDVFDPSTFLSSTANGTGKSRRKGVEVEAVIPLGGMAELSANYSYLDAEQPAADGLVKETRRPRHRGAVTLHGTAGRLRYGASLALTGKRIDTDFDLFPAQQVTLDSYALASARLAYRLGKRIDLSLRVSNAFDADYQDVVGYHTRGRSAHVGLVLRP